MPRTAIRSSQNAGPEIQTSRIRHLAETVENRWWCEGASEALTRLSGTLTKQKSHRRRGALPMLQPGRGFVDAGEKLIHDVGGCGYHGMSTRSSRRDAATCFRIRVSTHSGTLPPFAATSA